MSKFIDLDDKNDVVESKKIETVPATEQIIYNLVILDKSGSMASVVGVTISSYNEQLETTISIEKQHKNQKHLMSLVTFSDEASIDFWNKSTSDFSKLDNKTYCPGGYTALNDAIGISVNKLRKEIEDQKDKDIHIQVTIFTDGAENASREYSHPQVASLIKELQDTEKWKFAYIGANQDVVAVAGKYNIAKGNTLQYSADMLGTQQAFRSYSDSRAMYSGKIAAGQDVSQVDFFKQDPAVDKKEDKKDNNQDKNSKSK